MRVRRCVLIGVKGSGWSVWVLCHGQWQCCYYWWWCWYVNAYGQSFWVQFPQVSLCICWSEPTRFRYFWFVCWPFLELNALWVTIPLWHGMQLPANSTQFIILKAFQNICTFLGTMPTGLSCNSPKSFFVLLKWTAFRPALFWPDTVANQGSICWRLRAPLDLPTAANIQFFECCMSAYQSPDLNDVVWPPKHLFRRHSATYLKFETWQKRLQSINPHRGYYVIWQIILPLLHSSLYSKYTQNWHYRNFIKISRQVFAVVWSVISHLTVNRMGFPGKKRSHENSQNLRKISIIRLN